MPPVERLDGEAFTYVGPPPPGGTSASAGMFIRAGQRYFGKAWVRDTTHETLVAALWEILANDIFRYFGCHAQRLCLSLQRWLAGSEAFTRDPSCPPAGVHLLSEWIDGFCVLGPEFVSQLASGTFSDIAASVSVPGGSAPLHGLGAILAVAMLVGDSDSVGGKGANVGFTLLKDEDNSVVGAQAIKIDPGMAFALLSAPNPSKACRKSLNDIRSRRVSIHTGKQVAFDTLPARVRQEFTGIVRELRGINADHVTSFFLRPGMEDLFADPREAQGRIDFVLSRLAAMLETYGGEAAAASGDLDDPAAVLRAIKEGYARDAVLRDPVTGTKFPIEKRFVNLSLLEERKAEEGDAQLGGLNSFEVRARACACLRV